MRLINNMVVLRVEELEFFFYSNEIELVINILIHLWLSDHKYIVLQ